MSVGTMPEIIHDAESMPMSRRMQMATEVSLIFSEILSSMVLQGTWQTPMPRTMHTAVEVSRTICEGPPSESLPKMNSVHESRAMRVMNGIELSHADGLRGSRMDWVSCIDSYFLKACIEAASLVSAIASVFVKLYLHLGLLQFSLVWQAEGQILDVYATRAPHLLVIGLS